MTAPPKNVPPTDGSQSHLDACRASVDALRGLLDLLFPDVQNLDILTVQDIIDRYPLTLLGGPAMAAMEQSRRILRTRRDYQQIGLGEFHAGLIYLYWGDSRAAAQQFATARAQWSLAGDIPVGCLAYFAQGVALQHSYQLESAMTQFGWAERCLSRKQMGAQAAQMGILGDKMWPLLEAAQQAVRPHLWPDENAAPGVVAATPPPDAVVRPAAPQPEPPAAESAEATDSDTAEPPAEPPPRYDGPPVPRPISNLAREHPVFPASPVPGHLADDDRYLWYVVHQRRDGLLPDATEGTWILVDSRTQPSPADHGQDLVVIGGRQPNMGSVSVKPRTAMNPPLYYYLGRRAVSDNGRPDQTLILDNSGQALAIPDALLLGIVVGYWHNVIT